MSTVTPPVAPPSTETNAEKRARMLVEIRSLEARIRVLKANLPPALKSFFVFTTVSPKTNYLIYAKYFGDAMVILEKRLASDYPAGIKVRPKPKVFTTPEDAWGYSSGDFCTALRDQAAEFVADFVQDRGDFVANKKGKVKQALTGVESCVNAWQNKQCEGDSVRRPA